MTRGSMVHDDVSRHFGSCAQCRNVNPEGLRIQQPASLRRTVPAATIAALCSVGRSIYPTYLRWLAEPDE